MPPLATLVKTGAIELFTFPYENKQSAKVRALAHPSSLTWDTANLPWDAMDLSWTESGTTSELFGEIAAIVGVENATDAKHIDSAFRAKCSVFLTSDKGDILSNRSRLEDLTGLKFFHPIDDWCDFKKFVDSSSP